jgi:hypothetical protein
LGAALSVHHRAARLAIFLVLWGVAAVLVLVLEDLDGQQQIAVPPARGVRTPNVRAEIIAVEMRRKQAMLERGGS